jgi:hypothetical protein
MKRKIFVHSVFLLGALALGFQTAQAQEEPPDNGVPTEDTVPIEERLIKVCVAAEEPDGVQPPDGQQQLPQQGVIVFLPATANLVTLSAYSSFCSVEQDQTLLAECQCGGTPEAQ